MYNRCTAIDSNCDGLTRGFIYTPSCRLPYAIYKCIPCILLNSLFFYTHLARIITRAGLHNLVTRRLTLWITVQRITIKGHYYKSQARAPTVTIRSTYQIR
jgi:hypothetical protein